MFDYSPIGTPVIIACTIRGVFTIYEHPDLTERTNRIDLSIPNKDMTKGTVNYFSYIFTSRPSDSDSNLKGTLGITFIEKEIYMVTFYHLGVNPNIVVNEKRPTKSLTIGIIMNLYKSLILSYYNQDGTLIYE